MNRQQRRLKGIQGPSAGSSRLSPVVLQMMAAAGHLFQAQQLQEAERLLLQVLAAVPNHPPALHLLGVIAFMQERRDVAIDLVRKAVTLAPKDSTAHCSLGNLLLQQCRMDDAIASYRRALRLDPGFVGAMQNMANALSALRRVDEARDTYRQALAIAPDEPEIHVNLGTLMLSQGDMPAGWIEHEWRWKAAHFADVPRVFTQPQWRGEAAAGQTLLVHAEQGFGDNLHFCRYVTPAAERGLQVIIEVPQPLQRLMRSVAGAAEVVVTGGPLPPFDLHCPMMSLPLAFQTTLDTIPRQVPYLRPDPADVVHWRDRLAALGRRGPLVGLVWEGGVDKEPHSARAVGRKRSMAPETLAPLLDVPGVHFVSLQKAGTRAPATFGLTDLMHDVTDFADTAALIENLDLVISIDTSVVHLAGALGRPVWLMDRFLPCWRWMAGGAQNPWYPTLRLYRQSTPADWTSVVAAVADDLRDFAAAFRQAA